MQSTLIADLLIPFCEAGSLNIRDVSRTVRKRLIVSMSFVDHVSLHDQLFKDHHMDWNGINDYLQVRWGGGSFFCSSVIFLPSGNLVHSTRLDTYSGLA